LEAELLNAAREDAPTAALLAGLPSPGEVSAAVVPARWRAAVEMDVCARVVRVGNTDFKL
jgi:hypothetical protein